MNADQQQARLEEAFERIEETILPCIAMPFIDAEAGETLGGPKFRERDGGFITFSPNTLQSNIDALIRNGQRHLRRPSCWKQAREQAS